LSASKRLNTIENVGRTCTEPEVKNRFLGLSAFPRGGDRRS
jgi:hypothetical protein